MSEQERPMPFAIGLVMAGAVLGFCLRDGTYPFFL